MALSIDPDEMVKRVPPRFTPIERPGEPAAAVWVLSWRCADNSAHGILRVYDCEARAQRDMDLLADADMTDRIFTLSEHKVTR